MMVFLSGDNDHAIRSELEQIKEKFIKEHGAGRVERYEGEELSVDRLPDLMRGGSLFGAQRLVIIHGARDNKELVEYLAENAGSVDEETTLVLVEPKADKRTSWFKKLAKLPGAKLTYQLKGAPLLHWLLSEAKRRGAQLDASIASFLIQRVGEDQWRLSTELDKLLLAGPKIGREQIEELVEPSPSQSVFDLLEDILQGRVHEAYELYDRLRLSEIEPQQFISLLAWQVNAMLIVKSAGARPPSEISAKSGLSPYVVGKSLALVRKLKFADMAKLVDLVIEADSDSKKTGADADRRVKLLIGQINELISS